MGQNVWWGMCLGGFPGEMYVLVPIKNALAGLALDTPKLETTLNIAPPSDYCPLV